MNWVKGFALVTCLATPLVAAKAEPAATAQPSATKSTDVAAMTDAEKKAKAADCTKQANDKKLHGTERLKFRKTCLKG